MQKINILIVEDEPSFVLTLKMILPKSGFEVCGVASSGSEAIKLFYQTRPDVILMDVGLQDGSSGIDISKKIRENSDVPIVFLTGQTDENLLSQLAETAYSTVIEKPVDLDGLVVSIAKLYAAEK